jgi:LmbE family N-acetylglucosaminyl deacetylase
MFKNLRKFARGTQTLTSILSYGKYQKYVKEGEIGLSTVEPGFFKGKNVLVIAPHFDDETFGCGGTIARFAEAGSQISILYLTDGTRGTETGKIDGKLKLARKIEVDKATTNFGPEIKKVYLDHPDGALSTTANIAKQVSELIAKISPTDIFIPCFVESNDDHANAFLIASSALEEQLGSMPKLDVWQYEVWTPLIPNRIVPIGEVLERKMLAINEHKSQIKIRKFADGIIGLNQYRGIVTANLDGPAEAFFTLPIEQFLSFNKDIHITSKK